MKTLTIQSQRESREARIGMAAGGNSGQEASKTGCRSMDEESWVATLERYGAQMRLFALQFAHCREDAEDIVQEAFVRFWQGRSKTLPMERQVAHLFGCVRWSALDWRRRQSRRRAREERFAADAAEESYFEDDVARREWAREVRLALQALPEGQRQVVVLKVWAQLTFAEIGESLGVSPHTASSRYRYALESLKRKLGSEGSYV